MEKLRAYCQILGISPGASLEEIKQAYRDSVHVWHPDRFHNNLRLREKAEAKMREINHAYEKLVAFINDYGTSDFSQKNEKPTSSRVEPDQKKTSDSEPQNPAQKRGQSKLFTLANESLPYLFLVVNTIVISILIFIKSSILYQGDISFWSLVGESTVIFGIVGIITGLVWLFFRKKGAGKVRKSFLIASWVIFCLTVFGQYQSRSTAINQTTQHVPTTSGDQSSDLETMPSYEVKNATRVKISKTMLKIYKDFPFLDCDNEVSNSIAISEVSQACAGLVERGIELPDALRIAAAQVGPKYGPSDEKKRTREDYGMVPLSTVPIDVYCIALSRPIPQYKPSN